MQEAVLVTKIIGDHWHQPYLLFECHHWKEFPLAVPKLCCLLLSGFSSFFSVRRPSNDTPIRDFLVFVGLATLVYFGFLFDLAHLSEWFCKNSISTFSGFWLSASEIHHPSKFPNVLLRIIFLIFGLVVYQPFYLFNCHLIWRNFSTMKHFWRKVIWKVFIDIWHVACMAICKKLRLHSFANSRKK